MKINNNDKCSCGSNLKYKKCCRDKERKESRINLDFKVTPLGGTGNSSLEDAMRYINKSKSTYDGECQEGLQEILNREGDQNLEFLKKTIFKKVSYVSRYEYNSLFAKHHEENTLQEFSKYIMEVKKTPVEGKTEFTFDEVIADKNICYNDDGQIFTTSNYMYEFEDISEMGCIGTWNVINSIIWCIRNSETEEA